MYFCSCLVVFSSYVYLLYYVCIALLCTLDAGLLARSQYTEGPAMAASTQVFLVSLSLKANAEMVPNIPSCHYMLLM